MRVLCYLQTPFIILFLSCFSVAQALPTLGTGKSIDSNGNIINTQTSFEGGVSANGVDYNSYLQATPSASVSLKARIIVDPADVGKQADLLYVSGIEKAAPFDGGSDTSYFTVNDVSELHELDLYNLASVWMAQLTEAPFRRGVTLQSEMFINDEGGWQLSDQPSANYYFIGYRLPEGTVVYTTTPIMVSATQTSNAMNTCTYDFEAIDRLSFSEQTQYGKTTVTTQSGCQWTASSNTDWITISSDSSGNGTGVVTYAVAPNLGSDLKTGTVTIAGKTLTITVPPKPVSSTSCSYDVSPTSSTFPSSGKSGIIRVTTQPGCNWAASSDTDWINIESITVNRENGTGMVIYTAAANSTSSQKTGYITVAGIKVIVVIEEPTEFIDTVLVAAQVTDIGTSLGAIFTDVNKSEALAIFGQKDSDGRLISITEAVLISQSNSNQWVKVSFGVDHLPDTLESPDGTKVKFSNFTETSVDVTIFDAFGSLKVGTTTQLVNAQELKQLREFANNNTREILRKINCIPKWVDNLIWVSFQGLSVASCAASATATAATGGLLFGVALWACSSVILNGLDRAISVINNGKSPFKEVNGYNGISQTGMACGMVQMTDCIVGLINSAYGAFSDGKVKDNCREEPPSPNPESSPEPSPPSTPPLFTRCINTKYYCQYGYIAGSGGYGGYKHCYYDTEYQQKAPYHCRYEISQFDDSRNSHLIYEYCYDNIDDPIEKYISERLWTTSDGRQLTESCYDSEQRKIVDINWERLNEVTLRTYHESGPDAARSYWYWDLPGSYYAAGYGDNSTSIGCSRNDATGEYYENSYASNCSPLAFDLGIPGSGTGVTKCSEKKYPSNFLGEATTTTSCMVQYGDTCPPCILPPVAIDITPVSVPKQPIEDYLGR